VIAAFYGAPERPIKARFGNLLWKLPAIGERLKLYQLARFYRTIGMLLRGGTPLPTALRTGAELLHPLLRARAGDGEQGSQRGPPRLRSDGNQRPPPRSSRCECWPSARKAATWAK